MPSLDPGSVFPRSCYFAIPAAILTAVLVKARVETMTFKWSRWLSCWPKNFSAFFMSFVIWLKLNARVWLRPKRPPGCSFARSWGCWMPTEVSSGSSRWECCMPCWSFGSTGQPSWVGSLELPKSIYCWPRNLEVVRLPTFSISKNKKKKN